MSFTTHIKYLDKPECQIQSPPYRIYVGETGEMMTLIPMKNGETLDLPIFEAKRSNNGTLVVSEYKTDGHYGRKRPVKRDVVSINFTAGAP